MDEVYPLHEVSTKIALYSHDLTKVLIMQYRPDFFGLPGGHLEHNELPDEALARELEEELGITFTDFSHVDFFLRGARGSSVILGFRGIAPESLELHPPHPENEFGVWKTRDEIENGAYISEVYTKLVIENWPQR